MGRMIQLVYASRATRPVRFAELCSLLEQSQRGNAARGVTGKLGFDGTVFFQVLEGEWDDVNAIYQHIVKDERHHDFQLLGVLDVTERRWPGWRMAYCGLSEASRRVLDELNVGELDPYTVSAKQVLGMLEALPDLAKPEKGEVA